MAEDQPYNSLGQILAQGGEIALGLALYHGWNSGKIGLLLGKRLRVAPGSDEAQLYKIANDALAAGDYLNSLTPDQSIDPSQIPTVPEAFENLPPGTRVIYETEYRFGDEGKWWRYRTGEADIGDLSAITSDTAGAATGNKNTYVAKEGIVGDVSSLQPQVRFTLAVKAF